MARSICAEMHSGFQALRDKMPMNIGKRYPGKGMDADVKRNIDRIVEIWTECLATYGGPFLFGRQRGMADAMYAPVVTRFLTYGVPLNAACAAYCDTIMAMPEMQEWTAAARQEPDEIEELDMDF